MKKLIISYCFFISTLIFAQTKTDNNKFNLQITDSLYNKHTLFDIHIGYGTFSGGRIGMRVYPKTNFSVEISYGRDWSNFIGLSDQIMIYNLGINWKNQVSDLITYCFNIKYHSHVNMEDPGYLSLSPSIGVMNFKSSGINFWCRAGIFIAGYSFEENRFVNNIGLNLDIGIAFNIQK